MDVLDGLVNTKQQCKEIDSALKVGDFLEKTGPAEHTALEGIFCGLNHDGVKYREMSALDASNVLAESADGSIKITQEDMVCCLSLKDNHYVHSLVEYLSGKTVVLIALTGARSETAVGHWLTFVIYRNVTTGKQIVLRIDSLHNTGALQTEITTFLNYLESPSLIEKLSRTMSFMTDITTRK